MGVLAVNEWNRLPNSFLFAVVKIFQIEKFLGVVRVLWRRKVRGSRLGRSVECQSRGSIVIREVLVFREVCDSCWDLL